MASKVMGLLVTLEQWSGRGDRVSVINLYPSWTSCGAICRPINPSVYWFHAKMKSILYDTARHPPAFDRCFTPRIDRVLRYRVPHFRTGPCANTRRRLAKHGSLVLTIHSATPASCRIECRKRSRVFTCPPLGIGFTPWVTWTLHRQCWQHNLLDWVWSSYPAVPDWFVPHMTQLIVVGHLQVFTTLF